jgi:curved DNA-binding protein CbpA
LAQLESRDDFAVLGLSRSATDADVKKAYRTLAVQWHPDKNRENPKAEEYFKRIAEAYEALSDPEKRRQYKRSSTQGGGEGDTFSGVAFHSAGFSSRHARGIFESFFGAAHDSFDTPFFRKDGPDPFDTPFFRAQESLDWLDGASPRRIRSTTSTMPFAFSLLFLPWAAAIVDELAAGRFATRFAAQTVR